MISRGLDERIIIAGSGGQGVLLLGKLLCTAMMHEGKHVTYVPAYGTEVRGGTCNCNVRLSDTPVYSPQVEEATSLVLMNAPSYERFRSYRAQDGLMVVNSSLLEVRDADADFCVQVPASEIADDLGDLRVANVVALGALCASRQLVPTEKVEGAISSVLGAKRANLVAINVDALRRGAQIASESPASEHA